MHEQLIEKLQKQIFGVLPSIIGKKCALMDAPYYHNIGDVLIWQGERTFFEGAGIDCVYTASYQTCCYPSFEDDVTICFNGGGNIGDLYPEHGTFLLKLIETYPNNRFVIFPQTVHFEKIENAEYFFSQLNKHSNIYFCARDAQVAEYLHLFMNRVLLLPDMAFCVDRNYLMKKCLPTNKGKLALVRTDVESSTKNISYTADLVSDWPVFAHSFRKSTFFNKLLYRLSLVNEGAIMRRLGFIWDWFAVQIFRNSMIEEGIRFISPFAEVETERLHGAMLSILLGKKVTIRDNSYGKNKAFFETWLQREDGISLRAAKD